MASPLQTRRIERGLYGERERDARVESTNPDADDLAGGDLGSTAQLELELELVAATA
jgi:hypothetical protein